MTRRSASEWQEIARVTLEVDQAIAAQPRTHDSTPVPGPTGRRLICVRAGYTSHRDAQYRPVPELVS